MTARLHVPAVRQSTVGHTPLGAPVHAFEIVNGRGSRVVVLTLGGIIQSWMAPDASGRVDDIVLGLDSVDEYLTVSPYFGALVGRYANRIANARCAIGGRHVLLTPNNGDHSLHGGVRGFDKRPWSARAVRRGDAHGVALSLVSADGEEGFPGTLRVTVRYLLTASHALVVDARATTTRPTVVNLSQHTYFNLGGTTARDITRHELQLHADHYTPVDTTLIPTGELAPVDGTPFDFRVARPIGDGLDSPHPQVRLAGGYDHNLVIRRSHRGLVPAASLRDPASGRTLEVATTKPGLQLYTANFLDGTITGTHGRRFGPHAAVCLETQHFPDSPNQLHFPSPVLRPGQVYAHRTVYAPGVFAVE